MTQEILEILADVGNALESIGVSIRRQIAKIQKVEVTAVREAMFDILKWEGQKGAKIGPYEVAYKDQNLPEKWTHAYNILRQANAVISRRYHGDEYRYSYWLYEEGKIYRQLLKR